MMKAKELLNNTLKMLGYSDSDGNVELTSRIRNSAIVTINLVYGDLHRVVGNGEFEPIKSLEDEIKLPQKALGDVFAYGIAMHIARSENDGDQQQYYTMLYNARRAGLTGYGVVKNTWPRPEY
ncbi:MAG: hypothetical protein IKT42_02490 [Clostridia bacterium]|nr:hypothetical protein [Clostridia bacterium]